MSAPSRARGWALPLLAMAVLTLLFLAAALPTLAADPTASPAPGSQGNRPDHAGPKDKAKEPKEPITLRGTLVKATDDDGATIYRLTAGGTTYTLDAGPGWYLGDNHPFEARLGDIVTVVGQTAVGSTKIDVETIDGSTVRERGKPPWAGGWQRVGEMHPGWSTERAALMAEKLAARQQKFGGCFPPGLCKKQVDGAG